ncbi:hypothetical protein [Corynebacterium aquilae]|uniref:hypothetical protein n=1 Tax=Corynebacterium aquilae TaxID=203263 RepID=UPI0012EED5EC|nr:hypothetical protein [Corynebacterium aquilae]
MMIERAIDFGRPRRMRCGRCGYEELVSLPWMERGDRCPKCGVECSDVLCVRPVHAPDDPAIVDDLVARMCWYHTSTVPNWPQKNFDPLKDVGADYYDDLVKTIGRREAGIWLEKEKSKALHVGTYEAAIENMLRRIVGQPEQNEQFFLYRVVLHATAGIEPGVHDEEADFSGGMNADDLLTGNNLIYRYLNETEDEGSISLAIKPEAIESVAGIEIPLKQQPSLTSKLDLAVFDAGKWIDEGQIPTYIKKRLKDSYLQRRSEMGGRSSSEYLLGLIGLVQNPSEVLLMLDKAERRMI